MSNRREARARVLQALYAFELSGDEAPHVAKHVLRTGIEDDAETLRFAERLFFLTIDHADEADTLIRDHLENWDLKRLAVLDRLVLRLAVTELIAFEDIPPKVTINEAIELAKGFSTDQSGVFVNGILDAAHKALRESGRLKKRGRGLVDVSTPSASRSSD
jgi:transcription antitermination protein NusB